VKVTFWGVRGSLPAAAPDTVRYGGNTSCVEVRPRDGGLVVLDAGSGIRRLGEHVAGVDVADGLQRVDVLLTHLHMDHILGLGFFAPLFSPGLEVHLWGPSSTSLDLRGRLNRYLNPPLFPVRLPDLPCRVALHDVPLGTFDLPGLEVTAELVCHPPPSVGYRLSDRGATCAYLPDHEPALGSTQLTSTRAWTSGSDLAVGVDLLIHDAQYTDEEYPSRVGWGHSTVSHAVAFAGLVEARHLVPFHHDPARTDDDLDRLWDVTAWATPPAIPVTAAREGATFTLDGD
jgi:phosphoribosyl 1,2-cyclic phosphodiesterase